MEYRYIGKSVKRKDCDDIITGRALYLDDFSIPGMLFAKVLKSPYPHAEILKIDTTKAKTLAGVRAVLTYENVPDWRAGMPQHRLVLDKKLRYVGDGVAIVAAVSEDIAQAACDLIDVEYKVLPSVFDADEAIKPDAPLLYEQFPNNVFTPGCPLFEHGGSPFYQLMIGNTDKAFEECEVVAEDSISYDKCPCPLAPETPAVISQWTDENNLMIWASTQSPNLLKGMASMRMPGVNIRCKSFNVGGSYGNKQSLSMLVFYTAALSKATNLPVKYAMTKAEQLAVYDQRLGSKVSAKMGLKKDGTIHALKGMWLVDTGISSDLAQGQTAVGLGEAQLVMAKCKNWALDTKLVATNRCPSGIVKGFGGQELKSALILVWRSAMRKLGIDPVECYLQNIIEPGDTYVWRDGRQYVCREVNYKKAIIESAEKFEWSKKWKGWGIPTSVNGNKAVGVGVALHGNADAGEDDSEAYVRLEFDGTVILHCLITESGMGQRNSAAKVVAETLQTPFENVKISDTDTLGNPADFGLAGSRGTKTVGTAVYRAAIDAKNKLLEKAASVMGLKMGELDTADCFVFEKNNPDNRRHWSGLLGHLETITGVGRYAEDFTTPNFFIIFVEVEVDLETGKAEIIKTLGGSDVGRIIDPVQLEMQYHGGIGSAGTDTGHLEGHVLDKQNGRLLTANMIDYKWRPFNQFTSFESIMLEGLPDVSPYKAIGCGEISGAGGPSAVLMAISNAIGVDISEYPATPDVVLKALGKA